MWDFPNLYELNVLNRWHLWDQCSKNPILESAEIDFSNIQEIRQLLQWDTVMKHFQKGTVLFKDPWLPIPTWRGCGGMNEVVKEGLAESQVWLSQTSHVPPLHTPGQRFWYHFHYLIPIFEYLLNCAHYCNWESLHLLGVLEEIKWLWTIVLQVKYKILCLLFKGFYCLSQLPFISLTLTFFFSPHHHSQFSLLTYPRSYYANSRLEASVHTICLTFF